MPERRRWSRVGLAVRPPRPGGTNRQRVPTKEEHGVRLQGSAAVRHRHLDHPELALHLRPGDVVGGERMVQVEVWSTTTLWSSPSSRPCCSSCRCSPTSSPTRSWPAPRAFPCGASRCGCSAASRRSSPRRRARGARPCWPASGRRRASRSAWRAGTGAMRSRRRASPARCSSTWGSSTSCWRSSTWCRGSRSTAARCCTPRCGVSPTMSLKPRAGPPAPALPSAAS